MSPIAATSGPPKILASGSRNNLQSKNTVQTIKSVNPIRRSYQVTSTRIETSPYTRGSNQIRNQLSDASKQLGRTTETAKATYNPRFTFTN